MDYIADNADFDYGDYSENVTYDYPSNIKWLPLNELVPCVAFYTFIGLFGISGNILVIVAVLAFPPMRNVTNVFLFSLASADLLLLLICVPIKCATYFSYTWRMGEFLCVFTAYIQNVSMVCSVMTLTVMSIERFIAIMYPLRARSLCTIRHARLVTILIWVMSFVSTVPILSVQYLKEVGKHRKAYWCVKRLDNQLYSALFEIYMFCILFCLPLSIMLYTYTRISIEIWSVVSRRAALQGSCADRSADIPLRGRRFVGSSSGGYSTSTWTFNRRIPSDTCAEDMKTRKRVIVMLIIIVILFALCWGPILLNNLLVATNVLSDLNTGYLKPMRMAFNLLSFANSCVNPIVYGIMSNQFRNSIKKTLPCSKLLKRNQFGHVNSMNISRTSYLKSISSS